MSDICGASRIAKAGVCGQSFAIARPIPSTEDGIAIIISALTNLALQSPQVRALAWSCFHPPLLTRLPDADTSISAPPFELNDDRANWLKALDRDDSELQNYLHQHCRSPRLGLIFESLWHFFLRSDPQTELIAHNHPVRDAGKRSLGEFDVLYFCHRRQCAVHLELAVKFYLRAPPYPAAGDTLNWLGPNRADRLDLKLKRLASHQFPLARSPEGQASLQALGIDHCLQELHLSGRVFSPLQAPNSPTSFHPEHDRGIWQTHSDFLRREDRHQWRYLDKPEWLGGQHTSALELSDFQLAVAQARPIMLIDPELNYLFVTPDDWPQTMQPR